MDYAVHDCAGVGAVAEALVLDDFLTTPITTRGAVELFEVLEAREGRRATNMASQLQPEQWCLRIEGGPIADSILGGVASAARFLDLEGPDMRRWLSENRREEG